MEYRLLVCGGRDYLEWKRVEAVLDAYRKTRKQDLLIIQGGARGADLFAKRWAFENRATVMEFPANWRYHGKGAGVIRNREMLRWGKPDEVVAFPGGRGTANMVAQAKAAGIRVNEIVEEKPQIPVAAPVCQR